MTFLIENVAQIHRQVPPEGIGKGLWRLPKSDQQQHIQIELRASTIIFQVFGLEVSPKSRAIVPNCSSDRLRRLRTIEDNCSTIGPPASLAERLDGRIESPRL